MVTSDGWMAFDPYLIPSLLYQSQKTRDFEWYLARTLQQTE